jgi:membrane-associated phospholipid phosphatase
LRRTLTFALALAAAAPAAAWAQQRPDLRFKTRVWPDGAIITTSLVATAIPLVLPGSFGRATCSPCNPAGLWSLDRATIGPQRSFPDVLSYVSAGAEAVMGVLFLADSRRGQAPAAFWEDATVGVQAVSIAAAATEWLKVLVHRPRPFLYLPTASGTPSADNGRGFPSSHSSVAFAAAAAYASMLHRRGLLGQHKLQVGLLFGAATVTAALRVVAHKHFPTDAMAGAVLGFAIGWTVPSLHAVLP